MSHPTSPIGFDHPCRETCSGWQQGYERGNEELQKYKAALQMWALSFYCDGETLEKAELKHIRFNVFVDAAKALGIDDNWASQAKET